LIYYLTDIDRKFDISDINLSIESLEKSIESLAKGDADVHAGLWTPGQKSFYCKYLGKKILIDQPFAIGSRSGLFVNNNSSISVSDFGNKVLKLYTVTEETGDMTRFRQYLRDNNIPDSAFDVEYVSESEIYQNVQDNTDVIGLWSIDPLVVYPNLFTVLDIPSK
jgi:hypothetical protein